MMELWVNSSKDEISVNAKYNAENEKECREVLEKFQQCINWWNCSNAIWNRDTDKNAKKRGIPVNSVPTIHLEEEDTSVDLKIDCEKIRELNKRMRNVLFGVSGNNESSS